MKMSRLNDSTITKELLIFVTYARRHTRLTSKSIIKLCKLPYRGQGTFKVLSESEAGAMVVRMSRKRTSDC